MRLKTKLHKWQLKFDRVFSEGVWQQVLILLGVFVFAQIIGWIVCSQLTFGENARFCQIGRKYICFRKQLGQLIRKF